MKSPCETTAHRLAQLATRSCAMRCELTNDLIFFPLVHPGQNSLDPLPTPSFRFENPFLGRLPGRDEVIVQVGINRVLGVSEDAKWGGGGGR